MAVFFAFSVVGLYCDVSGVYTGCESQNGAASVEIGYDLINSTVVFSGTYIGNYGMFGTIQFIAEGLVHDCSLQFDGIFLQNNAQAGGAVYVAFVGALCKNTQTTIYGIYSQNQATLGGAVFLGCFGSAFNSSFSIQGNFTGNIANAQEGGAVMLQLTGSTFARSVFQISDSLFEGNRAVFGGAVCIQLGCLNSSGSGFDFCVAVTQVNILMSGNTFVRNMASQSGGAISAALIGNVSSAAVLPGGSAAAASASVSMFNMRVALSVFRSNIAQASGGALSVVLSSITDSLFKLEDCVMDSNTASFFGGALSITSFATTQNQTAANLFNWTATSFELDGDRFANNTASVGGAIDLTLDAVNFIDNCSGMIIRQCSFQNHSARQQGGSIRFSARATPCLLAICGSSIINSSAGIEGGGLFVQGQAHVRVRNSSFVNCKAFMAGGAVGVTGAGNGIGTLSFVNSSIVSPEWVDTNSVTGLQCVVDGVGAIEFSDSVVDGDGGGVCGCSNDSTTGGVHFGGSRGASGNSANGVADGSDNYNSVMMAQVLSCVGGFVAASKVSTLQTTQLVLSSNTVAGFDSNIINTTLQLWVAQCAGCPSHFYSLNKPQCYASQGVSVSEACLPCPNGASCPGGAVVNSTDG